MKTLGILAGIVFANLAFLKVEAADKQNKLYLIQNQGQVKDQHNVARVDIDYSLHAPGIGIHVGNGQMHYQFFSAKGQPEKLAPLTKGESMSAQRAISYDLYRLDVTLEGANTYAQATAMEPTGYYEYYYNAGAEVPAYAFQKVVYRDIYPHIDWVLQVRNNKLEYEFVVNRGGDASQIRLRYSGGTAALDAGGGIVVSTPMGTITEAAPKCFDENGKEVPSTFRLANNVAGFGIAPTAGKVLIDPVVEWATYYGGSGYENCLNVLCDPAGNVYMCGASQSAENIATTGAFKSALTGFASDAYLAKLDSAGNRLWSTYYGGEMSDGFVGITQDKAGRIYLAGITSSTSGIATAGSHQTVFVSGQNAFLVKFTSSGMRLWGTYYGGGGTYSTGVACDDSGNVYMVGNTMSDSMISTPGVHQSVYSDSGDAFVVKFDSTGARKWGTYYGGISLDDGLLINVDDSGNVYVAGNTYSDAGIASPGCYQPVRAGDRDVFIAKLDRTGHRLWATYYGGSDVDMIGGQAISKGYVYVAGATQSTTGIASSGGYQPAMSGGVAAPQDMFVAKLTSGGARIWGSYYGGTGEDTWFQYGGNIVSVDTAGYLYLTGSTNSLDSIAGKGSCLPTIGGSFDAFIMKLDSAGNKLWGTYYGSCGQDYNGGCTADIYGHVYLVGLTSSSTGMSTPGSHQPLFGGGFDDAFLAKFNSNDFKVMGDAAICNGNAATYTIGTLPGVTGYTWVLPVGWTGSSTDSSVTAVADTPGGRVMVIVARACSNDTFVLAHVVVHKKPHATITRNGAVLSVPDSFVYYQWYLNGGATGSSNDSLLAAGNGTYYVSVTDSNGCSSYSDTLVVRLGVADVKSGELGLYPNPARKVLTVEAEGAGTLEIVGIDGRGLKSYSIAKGINNLLFPDELVAGVYLCRYANSHGAVVVVRLVVEP